MADAHHHDEEHEHSSGHAHSHSHSHGSAKGKRLLFALVFTLLFAGVEALTGWWAGSLALISDAGHMLTDSTALGLTALAAFLARRPAGAKHSYGLGRLEIIAAFFNTLFMLAVVVGLAVEAVRRLQEPAAVNGEMVMVVAVLGLFVNLAVIWVLSRGGGEDLNTRSAVLHVMGDLLGSVAAIIAGGVIMATGWTPIDPLLSILVSVLILVSAIRLLKETTHVLMEGVPLSLDIADIGQEMAAVEGVSSVHDLHVWTLDTERSALSAHVVIDDLERWPRYLQSLQALLRDRFSIEHVTLQPEPLALRTLAEEPLIPAIAEPATS